MFISDLVTIAKLWNQPRCPTMNEWIKKIWYIYTMEFDSAIKKNKSMSFAVKWMELEIIVVSEISQSHKVVCIICSLSFVKLGETKQSQGHESKRGTTRKVEAETRKRKRGGESGQIHDMQV
jgi:hypothetical protein